MKNKKGFTLIELLAIIVILAIIAVITVPIILGIVEDASKNAATDSAYGYKDAVNKYYAQQLLNNQNLKLNGTYTVTNGTLSGGSFGDSAVTNLQIQVSGTVPSSGSLTYSNNKLTGGCLVIGDYAVTFDIKGNVSSSEKGDCSSIASEPIDFATDSWATIKHAIDTDNTSVYSVGNTKEVEIDLNGNGTIESNESYTVRLSNKTFNNCDTAANGFSQTACGFVFEFIDVIGTHNVNSTNTNVGGWPGSDMYAYLNDNNNSNGLVSIYEKLPNDLKLVIADTYTVSGHGSTTGETNFTSTNKLYLLSRQEVSGDNSSNDTSYDKTRQLEYYQSNSSSSYKIKNTTDTTPVASIWWLRTARSGGSSSWYCIAIDGGSDYYNATDTYGVAPAFRIEKD